MIYEFYMTYEYQLFKMKSITKTRTKQVYNIFTKAFNLFKTHQFKLKIETK